MAGNGESQSDLFREMVEHYTGGHEAPRLTSPHGLLELTRTQEILTRYLPPPPAAILDVGGGPGVHAAWLARQGYAVHLIDPVPLHVAQAEELSRAQPEHPIASCVVGDARSLGHPDDSVEMVLLLGPLYHLTEREDRLQALREAARVLKPGGVAICAGISRYASMLDGIRTSCLDDPEFAAIVARDVEDGQHRNPTGNPLYFTTAYFHLPPELGAEVAEAGLHHLETIGVEGLAWLLPDLAEKWDHPGRRRQLLEMLRTLEREPSLLGVSAHILAVGRKGW